MSEKDGHTVSAEGITVRKHVDAERFKTPAIVIEIASTADRAVTAEVTEPIPEAFAIEDIGFHPEFGGEHWSVSGREVTFERTLDPGEEYTTVYGVRGVDDREVTAFLESETTVRSDIEGGAGTTTPPDDGGDGDGVGDQREDDAGGADAEELLTDDDGPVRDVIAGERDSLRTADSAESDEGGLTDLPESDEPVADAGADTTGAPGDGATDAESTDAGTTTGDTDAGAHDDGGSGDRAMPGSVADALAAEFEEGSVSEADERVLREALSDPASGSVDARIDHLQTRVGDLEAYADELERFLDEHGGGDSALADVEADLAAVIDRIDAIEEDLASLRESAASLRENVDALGTATAGIDDRLDDIETDVQERVEDVETSLRDRIDDVETSTDERIGAVEASMDERIGAVETATRDRIEEMEAATEDRFDDVEADIDDLGAEIAEMKEFRNQLSSALGPAAGEEQSSEE